jgi:hypothetical protein
MKTISPAFRKMTTIIGLSLINESSGLGRTL